MQRQPRYAFRCCLCPAQGDGAESVESALLTLFLHIKQRHRGWTAHEVARLLGGAQK